MNYHQRIEEKVALDIQEISSVNEYLIKCKVGCLDHTLGISYFRWEGSTPLEEPELYFETLHSPYHGFYDRVKQAWNYIFKKKPLGYDCTIISIKDAEKMKDIINIFITDYTKFINMYDNDET